MINQLQEDLNQLSKSQQSQEQQIRELYLQLDEIYEKKQLLQSPFLPKKNLFLSVRPEVLFQVFQFLDLRNLLQLKLINKDLNKVIGFVLPLKCSQLNEQVIKLVNDDLKELYEKKSYEIIDQLEQQFKMAKYGVMNMDQRHLYELKSLKCPPNILEQVCHSLLIIYESKFDKNKNIWQQALKFLFRDQLRENLTLFPAQNISNEQLKRLEFLDQITKEQVRRVSIAAETYFDLVKALVDLRRTETYIYKNKIYEVEQEVLQKQKIIKQLQNHLNKDE